MAKKKIQGNNAACVSASAITKKQLESWVGASDVGHPNFRAKLAEKLAGLPLERRQLLLRVVAIRKALDYMNHYEGPIQNALRAYLVHDRLEAGQGISIEHKQMAYLGYAHSFMGSFMEAHRPKKLGWAYDKEGLKNMVRELRGTKTGDSEAALYAAQYRKGAEFLRKQANKWGADIHDLEDWGSPQHHEPNRVAMVSENDWIAKIEPLLDMDRTLSINDITGEAMTSMDTKSTLRNIYRNIVTDGLYKHEPGTWDGAGLSSANALGGRRTLHFKDAESWITYQEEFGSANLYGALINHLERLARDVAVIESLGPNPNWGFKYLDDIVSKEVGSQKYSNFNNALYANLRGVARPGDSSIANMFQTGRNIITAAKLYKAVISAAPDLAYYSMTNYYRDLPVVSGLLGVVTQLNPLNKADRIFAAELGFIAEAALDHTIAANRFNEFTGSTFSAKVAETTMRASGLQPWTVGIRRAFMLHYSRELAKRAGTKWNDMPEGMQIGLAEAGILPADWESIGSAHMTKKNGVDFFDLTKLHPEVGMKFAGMIYRELNYVSPTDAVMVKAVINQGLPAGSWLGEMTRSAGQFKAFTIMQIFTHMSRMMHGKSKNRAIYTGALVLSATALGLMSVQAKLIIDGKDPRDMDEGLLLAAFIQGGVGGILTDIFLNFDKDNYRQSLTELITGPLPQVVLDQFLLETVMFPIGEVADDLINDTGDALTEEYGREVASKWMTVIRQNMPAIWQFKMFVDRSVWDQMQLQVDPNYTDRIERRADTYERKHDKGYWWPEGETSPDHTPEKPLIFPQ